MRSSVQNFRGLEIRSTLDEFCDPHHMALVVYDMQVGIARQIADSEQIAARIAELVRVARNVGMRIIFTRHISAPLAVAGTAALRTAMAWQRKDDVADVAEAFPPDAPQTQLLPELGAGTNDVVLDKFAMSAFVGTPLELLLRDAGIEAFAIAGIALEVGIEPTVRHGLDLGFVPVLVTDACGSGDAAAADRSLAQLAWFGGSFQTTTDELVGKLRI
jgi:biuret amidohydrolase